MVDCRLKLKKMIRALVVFVLTVVVVAELQNDPARLQIVFFKEKTEGPIGIMTTSNGAPVDVFNTVTLNSPLIFNENLMDSLTHLVRERIPERVVHAKAAGAFGYFEVTHNITNLSKAKFLSKIGETTPIAVRFSPVPLETGGIDTGRHARGFALKFYTEDGNFDIAGFNTPMYFYKDPILFTPSVRIQKKNPATNLVDNNMFWDYFTLKPESLFTIMYLYGDRGIPDGYRHMPGFAIHTYEVINEHGEKHFIRFHFLPDAGIKNLLSEQARNIAAVDPDYATRDLYNAIGNGNFPSWKVSIQILTWDDVKSADFDVFDVTRVLPVNKYPLRPIGRFVLNKNPLNYFAEIEQLAFNPANLVPGILGAPDKLFESRRLAYRDAQYYRLGANFNKIPVNCPILTNHLTYNRNGVPPLEENGADSPNYYPNSFNGAVPYDAKYKASLTVIHEDEPNNFDQARDMYENEMTSDERTRLVENIVYSLTGTAKFLQDRAVKLFTIIHSDLGQRISESLSVNGTKYQL